jgi:hypothetical protein
MTDLETLRDCLETTVELIRCDGKEDIDINPALSVMAEGQLRAALAIVETLANVEKNHQVDDAAPRLHQRATDDAVRESVDTLEEHDANNAERLAKVEAAVDVIKK